MKKSKIIGSIVGIVVFVAMIAGLTYAWFTWRSSNIPVAGNSNCFIIDYDIGQEIGSASDKASFDLVESYDEGQAAIVTLSINEKCVGMKGKGVLYLNTNSAATDNAIIKGALKYTIIKKVGDESEEVGTGTITTKNKLKLVDNIPLDTTSKVTYEVWVWIDGTIADNTYYKANYSGYISAEVTQVE